MTQPTTPPPLTEEEIARLKSDIQFTREYSHSPVPHVTIEGNQAARLIADLEAAQAEIKRLEAERQWKPTHRHKQSGVEVEAFKRWEGRIEYRLNKKATSFACEERFKELYEPLSTDTVEGGTVDADKESPVS